MVKSVIPLPFVLPRTFQRTRVQHHPTWLWILNLYTFLWKLGFRSATPNSLGLKGNRYWMLNEACFIDSPLLPLNIKCPSFPHNYSLIPKEIVETVFATKRPYDQILLATSSHRLRPEIYAQLRGTCLLWYRTSRRLHSTSIPANAENGNDLFRRWSSGWFLLSTPNAVLRAFAVVVSRSSVVRNLNQRMFCRDGLMRQMKLPVALPSKFSRGHTTTWRGTRCNTENLFRMP